MKLLTRIEVGKHTLPGVPIKISSPSSCMATKDAGIEKSSKGFEEAYEVLRDIAELFDLANPITWWFLSAGTRSTLIENGLI